MLGISIYYLLFPGKPDDTSYSFSYNKIVGILLTSSQTAISWCLYYSYTKKIFTRLYLFAEKCNCHSATVTLLTLCYIVNVIAYCCSVLI